MTQRSANRKQSPPITQFKGYYQFLSIDYKAKVYYQGFLYGSVAAAFQAARTNDVSLRRKISQIQDKQQFKKIVAEIQIAPDWPHRRLNVMTLLNRDKFKRNRELGLKLFATQSRLLVNGYQKGGDAEMFWGAIERNSQYQGLNTLGKILSNLRQEMRLGLDNKNWVNELNLQTNEELWPEANLILQKQGNDVDNLMLVKKNSFFIGSHQLNDFRLQHPSVSKFHASIYFSTDMQLILIDLNSAHGTVVQRGGNEIKLEALRPQSLQDKDIIRIGSSNSRYTIYFNFDQVQRRQQQRQRKAKQQQQRVEMQKRMQQEAIKSRNAIKPMLQVKDYACLYVQNVNRNFTYNDIREQFNKYGQVKNVKINNDPITSKFMGSVLVYFDQKVKVRNVLQKISHDPIKFQFRVVAVSNQEAEKITASFTNKQKELQRQRRMQQLKQKRRNQVVATRKREVAKESRSRSRSRRKSSSQSSSSSKKSSESGRPSKKRELRSHDK